MVTKEYLLTSSEKDDYTATEDTGVSLGSQNRKKKINKQQLGMSRLGLLGKCSFPKIIPIFS